MKLQRPFCALLVALTVAGCAPAGHGDPPPPSSPAPTEVDASHDRLTGLRMGMSVKGRQERVRFVSFTPGGTAIARFELCRGENSKDYVYSRQSFKIGAQDQHLTAMAFQSMDSTPKPNMGVGGGKCEFINVLFKADGLTPDSISYTTAEDATTPWTAEWKIG